LKKIVSRAGGYPKKKKRIEKTVGCHFFIWGGTIICTGAGQTVGENGRGRRKKKRPSTNRPIRRRGGVPCRLLLSSRSGRGKGVTSQGEKNLGEEKVISGGERENNHQGVRGERRSKQIESFFAKEIKQKRQGPQGYRRSGEGGACSERKEAISDQGGREPKFLPQVSYSLDLVSVEKGSPVESPAGGKKRDSA